MVGGALVLLPLVLLQHAEELVAPLRGGGRKRALETARPSVVALAGATDRCQRVRGHARAVGLAEGMAAADECHRLLVVHAHAPERIADVQGAVCRARVRRPNARRRLHDGTFGVQVDQANGRAAQGLLAMALRRTRSHQLLMIGGAQVQAGGAVGIVDAAHAELRHRSAHALDRGAASRDEQISPAEASSVLLLDGPQQGACIVEVPIVLPIRLRREALPPASAAPAAVRVAEAARAMPSEPDE
mmetsp:Transcript_172259/g.552214  ORF Transcript_172259/g.552214 Transcript_172259/m.552214 type:complete len:245 (+) Transcript_172259:670-1404(+)